MPFIAGSMGMHTGKFWIYNIIGSILWATTIIILGVAFVTYYKIILAYISYVLAGILALVVLYIALFKRDAFKAYLREKEQEMEEKLQKKV